MKNKGFTLVEMLVSFSLASIVMILLLNILLTLKNIYVENGMKTILLINQANFNKKIEDAVGQNTLIEVSSCGDACLTFIFQDGKIKTLSYNPIENTLTFDNDKAELTSGTKVGKMEVQTQTIPEITDLSYNNAVLSIQIPITHSLIDGEFGVNFVYPYNTNVTVVNVT